MFPVGSDGSTAMPVTRLALPFGPFSGAGPTGVQTCFVSGLVASWVKMRKGTVNRSSTASPSPDPGTT